MGVRVRARMRSHLRDGIRRHLGNHPALEERTNLRVARAPIDEEADGHRGDENPDEAFEVPDTQILHRQKGERVDRGDQAARPDGDQTAGDQIESDACAHYLLDVSTNDCQLHLHVDRVADPSRVLGTHGLREVPSRHQSEPSRHLLEHKTHDRRPPQDPHDLIASVRSLLQVALEVARIQVGQRHEPTRPGKSPQLAPGEAKGHWRRGVWVRFIIENVDSLVVLAVIDASRRRRWFGIAWHTHTGRAARELRAACGSTEPSGDSALRNHLSLVCFLQYLRWSCEG